MGKQRSFTQQVNNRRLPIKCWLNDGSLVNNVGVMHRRLLNIVWVNDGRLVNNVGANDRRLPIQCWLNDRRLVVFYVFVLLTVPRLKRKEGSPPDIVIYKDEVFVARRLFPAKSMSQQSIPSLSKGRVWQEDVSSRFLDKG